MDSRWVHIGSLLASYAVGQFDKRVSLSERSDDIDAMIEGLNMLGEELNELTITRDFFNTIFNSVSDMVLVLSAKGIIEEINEAACKRLGYPRGLLIGQSVNVLSGEPLSLWQQLAFRRRTGVSRFWDRRFRTAAGRAFPVELTVSPIQAPGGQRANRVLIIGKDITPQLAAERSQLRAAIDAQEAERLRLARELHDSIGQQLSAVKFVISTAVFDCGALPLQEKLESVNQALAHILAEMRGICFNLAPDALADRGLVDAVRLLAEQVEKVSKIRVVVEYRGFPPLSRSLETDLYRVIQEFISNGIRHGEATRMVIGFSHRSGNADIRLQENGRGFDPGIVQGHGMGLRNMQSRVRSHGGVLQLVSSPGKGVKARIRLAVN